MRATADYNTKEQGTQQAKKEGNTHTLHSFDVLKFTHLQYRRHTRDTPVDERRGR